MWSPVKPIIKLKASVHFNKEYFSRTLTSCVHRLNWCNWKEIIGWSRTATSEAEKIHSSFKPTLASGQHRFDRRYYFICQPFLQRLYWTWCLYKWRTREDEQMGGEWEPIKIHHRNLAYIPKSTRHPSLLTRSGPHSHWITISPRNLVRNHSENTRLYWQGPEQDWRWKSDRKTIYTLTGISPNTWWASLRNHRKRII
jgi:hypothetical protein